MRLSLIPHCRNTAAEESRTDGERDSMDINGTRQKQSNTLKTQNAVQLPLSWRHQVMIPVTCTPLLTCCNLVISWKKHQSFNPGQCFSDPYCDAEAVTPVLTMETKTFRTCHFFPHSQAFFSRIQSKHNCIHMPQCSSVFNCFLMHFHRWAQASVHAGCDGLG